MKTQKHAIRARSELGSARKQIRVLHAKMGNSQKIAHFSEKTREQNEAKHKALEKKKAAAKKKAKLAKKEKLSDILMDHGAKYLAFKAAKEHKDEHSDKQKKKTLAAVKKTRADLKKSKKHYSKHKMRHHCLNAAKKAVKAVLKEQDALIEKAAQKWVKVAIKKYPAAIAVSEHPDKPNVFVAPPMVHLSLTGGAPSAPPAPHKEVKPLKKEHKAAKKAAKKPKKMA